MQEMLKVERGHVPANDGLGAVPAEAALEGENNRHPSPDVVAASWLVTRGSATNTECPNALAVASACDLCDSLKRHAEHSKKDQLVVF